MLLCLNLVVRCLMLVDCCRSSSFVVCMLVVMYGCLVLVCVCSLIVDCRSLFIGRRVLLVVH